MAGSFRVKLFSLCLGLCVALAPNSAAAHPYTIDQHQELDDVSWSVGINSPVGQEFVPSFTSLDVVELLTRDSIFGGGTGTALSVTVRAGSITGTVLGASLPVLLPAGFDGWTHFDFPTPVALVPGNVYVMEIGLTPGTEWTLAGSDSNAYLPGCLILNGSLACGYDAAFREGPAAVEEVPEPSAMLILSGGLLALGRLRRRTPRGPAEAGPHRRAG